MGSKTRKNKKHIYAKKATQIKCLLKSCKARKYQSVYGVSKGGAVRSNPELY